MLKKTMIALLIVVMTVTFMPSLAFSADSGSAKTNTKTTGMVSIGKQKLSKKKIGAIIRNDEEDVSLTNIKEMLRDAIKSTWNESVEEEEDYCPEVWNEMQTAYDTVMKKVNDATSADEIIEGYFFFFIIVPDEILEPIQTIEALGSQTKQYVTGASDLRDMKTELKKDAKKALSGYKASDYNSYYRGLINDRRAELAEKIDKVSTFREYALVAAEVEEIEENEEDSYIEIDEDSEDEEEGISIGNWVYTNQEMSAARKLLVKWAKEYIRKDLPDMGYKGKKDAFDGQLKTFKAQLKRDKIMTVMLERYNRFLQDVTKAAGIDESQMEEASGGDIVRLKKKMKQIFYQYKKRDYSSDNWDKLGTIYEKYIDRADMMYLQVQVRDSVVDEMKAEMDKVPDKKKELKKLKGKYRKNLKKYLNGKKYNQKKAKPIVRKALKAVSDIRDPEELRNLYKSYTRALKKTLRSFWIKTGKSGAGTVSKSKTVKYGKKYVVKVTPRAGHRTVSVKIDGKYRKLKNKYTFKSVKKSHTVYAVFQ